MARVTTTLLHTFLRRAAEHPDRVAWRELRAGGSPADASMTWEQWQHRARSFAFALQKAGGRPGDRVAVLAGSTMLWPIAELGAQLAGMISVGLYPTSAPTQVHAILNDCAARVVVVDTPAQLEKVRAVRAALPTLRTVVSAARAEDAEAFDRWITGPQIEEVHEARPDDVAILIYTSGSTGEPKGARITHRYLRASARSIADTLQLTNADSSLSFLPFCHAAERVFGLYTRIHCGMTAGLVADHNRIWDAARAFEPTLFGGLPRFYEKLYEALLAEEHDRRADRIKEFVGARVRVATSGGATLPVEIVEFLRTYGFEVVGAYGLTEHLCVAMHRPGASGRPDSVGRPMPGTTVRISESGEILVRASDLTFAGYHGKPEETSAAFTSDGEWLRTGDLGTIDSDGFLYVSGREKELIALSTGKKVAPLPIEARLLNHPMISQAVLVGENRKYVSALIALRPAVVQSWARDHRIDLSYEQILQHPALFAIIQQEIDRVNSDLSRTEQIKRFAVLPRELSIERDELTPTLKVRRSVIVENYRQQLESLYQVSA
jgi:long-chain acyl-CoA synthetase